MKVATAIEVIPVLEIGPMELDIPLGRILRAATRREIWQSDYWKLFDLPPVQRTTLVAVSAFARLRDYHRLKSAAAPLAGGCVLRIGGKTVLKPGCCGTIDSVAGWVSASRSRSRSWRSVWNGHPLVAMRRVGATVEVSNPYDVDEKPIRVMLQLDAASFRVAVRTAHQTIEALASRLEDQLGSGRTHELLGVGLTPGP